MGTPYNQLLNMTERLRIEVESQWLVKKTTKNVMTSSNQI